MTTPSGSGLLEEATREACHLLDVMAPTPELPRNRPINKLVLERCDGLIFTWTVRVGAVIGFSTGHGFFIRNLGDGKWSAPCFVTMTTGKAGALLGYEKVSSILAAMTPRLANQLENGFIPVFGVDVNVQSQDTFEVDPNAPGFGGFDRGPWGPSERETFGGGKDIIAVSTSKGAVVSLGNLQGGATTVDSKRNAECYGKGVSASDILSGSVSAPPELQPLFDKLAAIARIEPIHHRHADN